MHKFQILIATLVASQLLCANTCIVSAKAADDEPAFNSAGSQLAWQNGSSVQPRPRYKVTVGDAFGGFIDVEREIDEESYSLYRENDPFSSGIPTESLVALTNGTIGPGAFLNKLTAPRLSGATNETTDRFSSSGAYQQAGVPLLNPSKSRAKIKFRHSRFIPVRDRFSNKMDRTNLTGDCFSSTGDFYGFSDDSDFDLGNHFSTSEPATYASEIIGHPAWRAEQMPLKIYISRPVEAARRGYVQNVIYETLKQSSAETRTHVRFQITYKYQEADIFFVSQECEGAAEQVCETRRGVLSRVKIALDSSTLWSSEPQKLRRVCLEQAKHALGELGTPVSKFRVVDSIPTPMPPGSKSVHIASTTQGSGKAFKAHSSAAPQNIVSKKANSADPYAFSKAKPLVARALLGFNSSAPTNSAR